MHTTRWMRGIVPAFFALLAAGFIAGCKKDTDTGNPSKEPGKRVNLSGKIEVDNEPVKTGYLLFMSENRPDANGKFDPELGPPGMFRYGWAKVTKGKYKAEDVPVGMVEVKLYTQPEAFEKALQDCRVKAKKSETLLDKQLGRMPPESRPGPKSRPRGPGGDREGEGPPRPPLPSDVPSSASLPPRGPGTGRSGPPFGSSGPPDVDKLPGISGDPGADLGPRERKRREEELRTKMADQERGGPTDADIESWKTSLNSMEQADKEDLFKFNNLRKAVKVAPAQTQLDLEMPLPDEIQKLKSSK